MDKGYTRTAIWRIGAGAMIGALVVLAVACGSDDAADEASGRGNITTSGESARPPGDTAGGVIVGDDTNVGQAYDSAGSNAPGGAPAPNGSTGGAPGLPALLDRKIIRTATVTVETDAVSARFEDVGNIAAGAGGFVSSSSFGNSGETQTASITVRVPGERYQDVISQLRKLGTVKGEQTSANDVTEEFTDLESRVRNLAATEAQYVEFLTRAANINEVLTVQDRLNATRAEIEQVQGRIQLLASQTDLATITVHLTPPAIAKEQPKPANDSMLDTVRNAWENSLEVLLGIATVTLAVLAFSWWIAILGVVIYIIVRRQSRPHRPAPPLVDPNAG